MRADWHLQQVWVLSATKVRDKHEGWEDHNLVGIAHHLVTGMRKIVSASSASQRAPRLWMTGKDPTKIAQILYRTRKSVTKWINREAERDPAVKPVPEQSYEPVRAAPEPQHPLSEA